MLEMKSLQDQPVEGFKITLVDEADMYNWEVAVFGPPNTHYEGGYFKVRTTEDLIYDCNWKKKKRSTCYKLIARKKHQSNNQTCIPTNPSLFFAAGFD